MDLNSTATYAGTLPSSLSIDNRGGASYSLGVDVPPGIAGIAPKLSFAYSSLAGNGLMGMGWSLSGLSVIERVASTLAQDSYLGGIEFADTDRLSIDQSRLVPRCGSSYFGADTVFETEIQSWHKVVPIYGSTPGRHGPDSFEVYQRNGRVFRYGATTDSQGVISQDNPSIRAWYLSSITDRLGNCISFSYIDAGSGGNMLPSRIDYTSNKTTPSRRSVRFFYEARSDILSRYVGGHEVSTNVRLQSVTTYVDENTVSAYALGYENGSATGRSRLISLTREDGSGIPLPPITFSWQDAAGNFCAAKPFDAGAVEWSGTFLPMDIDGDGRVDFVNVYSDHDENLAMTIFLSQADGSFAPPIVVPPSGLPFGGQLLTLDANGDGKMEIAYAFDNQGKLGITLFAPVFQNDAWTLVHGALNGAGPSTLQAGGMLIAADVDGDGLADIVLVSHTDEGLLQIVTLFSDGAIFAPSLTDTTAPTIACGGSVMAFDANADGMDDLVYVTSKDDGAQLVLTLFKSLGRNGFTEIDDVLDGVLSGGGLLIPVDVNADGNTDLIYFESSDDGSTMMAITLLNDGHIFHALQPQSLNLPSTGLILPMSLTASPSPELLVMTHDTNNVLILTCFRTSPTGLTLISELTQPPQGTQAGGSAMPLDMRGVGFSDLVYAVNSAGTQVAIHMPVAGSFPDLMLTATNGLGAVCTVSYAPITDPSVYSTTVEAAGGMEPRCLIHGGISGASFNAGGALFQSVIGARQVLRRTPIVKYVVHSFSKSDGIGNTWSNAYQYENALIDLTGRGWLGFAAIEVTDYGAGTTTRNQFLQAFPLTQMISSSTVTRTVDGGLMTDAEFSFEAPQSGVSYQVLNTSNTISSYSFASSGAVPDTRLITSTNYDSYGNVIQVATTGNALAAGSVVVQAYTCDEASWQLSLMTSRIEYIDVTCTALLRQDRFVYDPTSWQVVTHSRWENVAAAWLDTSYAYDGFGNVISVTDPSGAINLTTFDVQFNSFVASDSVSTGQGNVIRQSYVYEPSFGNAINITDMAGSVRTCMIDGLGRVISESRTAPDGAVVETSMTAWTIDKGMLCQTRAQSWDWQSENWVERRSYTDGIGRIVRVERDSANVDEAIVVETSYDSRGAKLSQTLPGFESAPSNTATWNYDAFGRVTSASTPAADGSLVLTTTSYPRTDTTTTTVAVGTASEQSTTVQYGITAGGHVPISRIDASGGQCAYVYDGLGHLLSLTDPTGIVTTASFDTLGRQVATAISDSTVVLSSRKIAYNDFTRSTVETSATGSMTLTRDPLQRIVEKQISSGEVTTFLYDEVDMTFSGGRLSSVLLPNGDSFRYGYDADGNVVLRHVNIGNTTSVMTEAFLPSAKRASIVFPDGSHQTNIHGDAGVLNGVIFTTSAGTKRDLINYSGFDAYDNPGQVNFANGVISNLEYDVYGRLASKNSQSANGSVIFGDKIVRVANDAVVSVGEPDSPQTLTYDDVGRLQSSTGGTIASLSYAYDLSGNCTSAEGTSISYKGYSALSGTGAEPFTATYDADGALQTFQSSERNASYSYDAEQRLIAVRASGCASYTYDHRGVRTSKTEGGTTTVYIGPEYEIVQFSDGTAQHSCVVGERGSRDYVITVADQGNPLPTNGIPAVGEAYFICDHLRSVRTVLDGQGLVTATVDYDPFGSPNVVGASSFRYSFSGREFDEVAAAYYFGARYYDPRLKRFLTPDDQLGGRLLDRDTYNNYAYVLNNPLGFVDRTGHSWWEFAAQVTLDTLMVTAGVAAVAVTGGGANMVGSMLIGAGIGGLAYDVKQASAGNGAHVGWNNWGIQLGIGAATGLLTGGVSVGASSLLETAGSVGLAKIALTAGIMAVAGAGTSMAGTVANDAISGNSLTSGLGMAGISGGVAGLLGGAGSSIFASGLSEAQMGEEAASAARYGAVDGQASEGVPSDEPAPDAPAARGQKEYCRNFRNSLAWKTKPDGKWGGFSRIPVAKSTPRVLFGSMRSLLMSSNPDFATSF